MSIASARRAPRPGPGVGLLRWPAIAVAGLAVAAPLALIVYQSFLSDPFFTPSASVTLDAWRFVLADPDFWRALWTTLALAAGMTVIAVPVGAILAFLVVRTDLPGRRWLELALMIPVFSSAVVLAFGYVVAAGPVGLVSTAVKSVLGFLPWDIYSLPALIAIAGLTHVPHVYLYAAAGLRGIGSDLEEAARMAGASPLRVALTVSLPMIRPSLAFAAVLVFFLGFELFGLPLVLGDPAHRLVLTTYLYKLTNILGTPSYQLMAVVVVCIILIAIPLIVLQRRLLRDAGRYVSMRGKGLRVQPLRLGGWRWPALALILLWLLVTVVVPVGGVALRSIVVSWGEGVRLLDVLTLQHYRELLDYPNILRGILNTLGIGVIGGAAAIVCYTLLAIAVHRWASPWVRAVDYLVLAPRAMPGIVAGLAILWIFLFVRPLAPLRQTMLSVWLAYSIVWLAYGMRLVQGTLLQIGGELEEAAQVAGAGALKVRRDVTLPLAWNGMLAAWVLVFLIFVREYSTGVYLLGPGTEVIGSLLVSLWGTGAVDLVAALSVVNLALIGLGLAAALRLGARLHA
ncbi:MAG: iron ABC transporter permease [Dongiaceae bacterium]